MREQAASDEPIASAISLAENASSFGTIFRLNHTSPVLWMLAIPLAIAAMAFADCLATRAIYGSAAPWSNARGEMQTRRDLQFV
jgi:hypothetical protein